MSDMRVGFKAETTAGVADPTNAQLLADIQKALEEIEAFKADSSKMEGLTELQLNDIERMAAMLKAESAAISGLAANGSTAPGSTETPNPWNPSELQPEWNGIPANFINETDPYGQAKVSPDANYRGTLTIPNKGTANPTYVSFQMTDEMSGVKVESKGRDLIVTVTYTDPNKKPDVWVVKNGTLSSAPFVISARGLTHGVNIDCSHAIRTTKNGKPIFMSDGETPLRMGFYIIGSDYDDTIKGSIVGDFIVGGMGNDTIDAGFGDDTIFGDEGPGDGGVKTYKDEDFDPNGGNDTISAGGDGSDLIWGQGGINTVGQSDLDNPYATVLDYENVQDDSVYTPPAPGSGWFEGEGWDVGAQMEDGYVVFTNDGTRGGKLTFNMDKMPGYTMASGTKDEDNNLIITFINDDGKVLRVKVLDYFSGQLYNGDNPSDAVAQIVINASLSSDIIDFSGIDINEEDSGGQSISILGGEGDDIILGPRNKAIKDGIDLKDPTKGTWTPGKLNPFLEDGVFGVAKDDPAKGKKYGFGCVSSVEDGQIVIKPDGSGNFPDTITLVAPKDYTEGYITSDAAGNMYVILIKPSKTGGKPEGILVYKIDKNLCNIGANGKLGFGDIVVKHRDTARDAAGNYVYTETVALTPILMDTGSNLMDGQGGNDLYIVQEGSNINKEEGDQLIELTESTKVKKDDEPPAAHVPPTPAADDFDKYNTEVPKDNKWSDAEWEKWAKENDTTEYNTLGWPAYKAKYTNPYK